MQQLNDYQLRKATNQDAGEIWEIFRQAVAKRRDEGSDQWQDGYPNQDIIADDIAKGYGYVLEVGEQIIAYVAIIFEEDPNYADIKGAWLTDGDYTLVHRLAVAQNTGYNGIGTRVMQLAEEISIKNGRYSIKVDTNHDNIGMLRVFEKLGYQYCGEVLLRGNLRKAFEKILKEMII